jgi:ATP-dependent helicase/nuclease subunit B
MLRIVTGPFHPHLEKALAEEVRHLKTGDPFAPLGIVVPSSILLARLRDLLVREHGQALLNVHFFTFHQLARRLYEELDVSIAEECGPRIEPVQDLFYEHLLSRLVRYDLPGADALHLSRLAPGAWTVLWATLRDLKDAMVDPALALRAVAEGVFEPEENPKLRALFTTYGALLEVGRKLGVGLMDDLAAAVLPWVSRSRLLSKFQRLCYYGFYDLTQVQLSLFEGVAKTAPVTLYFPLCDDPAFAFARRFFERHLLSLTRSSEQVCHLSTSRAKDTPQVRIMNAVGPDDELTLVCKETLTLVETHGYRFDDIGVVARTLTPYQSALRRAFDQHRIPFTTTATAPAIQEPAIKVLLQLAALPLTGFYRAAVMDVVTSPFYRLGRLGWAGVAPRPDLWKLAVRSLGITRGEEEWQRLASAGRVEVWVGQGDEVHEEMRGRMAVEVAQLRLLWRVVSRLIRDLKTLPVQGSFGELTEAFAALAARHLVVPGFDADALEQPVASDRLASLDSAIQTALDSLRQLDRIEGAVGWEEWVRTFTRALEQAPIPLEPTHHAGVQVLDAMAARGLPFRALFLLGLNEKVFPRFIREDAFLRDRHRRVLDATLGYKIDEKLAGYDEEQLLFTLLHLAADSRLYALYQRADTEGRPLAASPYLDTFRPVGSIQGQEQEVRLPRRLEERMAMPQLAPALLTREELTLWLTLQGYDPSPLLNATGREAALFRHGWATLRTIEGEAGRLGPYDGIVGPLDERWRHLTERGLAPTPLEQYARCPFQYFAAQVLGLESVREQPGAELPAQAFGELCHAVLGLCYKRLVAMGWPQRALAPVSVRQQVQSAAEEVFTVYATEHGTGHALTWQMAQETVTGLVAAVVESDHEQFQASGFQPIGFEVEAEGWLEDVTDSGPLKIRGRLDRVDERATPPGIRVVDYKYKQGTTMKGEDRDLLTSAVQGYRLQPPLYALMTMRGPHQAGSGLGRDQALPEQVEFLFLAPRWEKTVDRCRFDSAAWRESAGVQLRKTLQTLLDGIRTGRYFILPNGYCDHCEFSAACRRFHGPTWWRAHSAPPAKQLRQLRKQKVKKNVGE